MREARCRQRLLREDRNTEPFQIIDGAHPTCTGRVRLAMQFCDCRMDRHRVMPVRQHMRKRAGGLSVHMREHDACVSQPVEGLASLPGIGPYTAGAIASIGYDRPEPAVDGNVFRVLTRVLDCDDPVDHTATRDALTVFARELVEGLAPGEKPSDFNQALMELGATVCTPRNPP